MIPNTQEFDMHRTWRFQLDVKVHSHWAYFKPYWAYWGLFLKKKKKKWWLFPLVMGKEMFHVHCLPGLIAHHPPTSLLCTLHGPSCCPTNMPAHQKAFTHAKPCAWNALLQIAMRLIPSLDSSPCHVTTLAFPDRIICKMVPLVTLYLFILIYISSQHWMPLTYRFIYLCLSPPLE